MSGEVRTLGEYISGLEHPEYWIAGMIAAIGAIALLAVRRWVRRSRAGKQRDFERALDTLLLPKERVQIQCAAGNDVHWVLTGKRLLIQAGGRYTAVPFRKIRRVQALDAAGKPTAAAAKMVRLRVQADREYVLENRDPEFVRLVKRLKEKGKQKSGKKAIPQKKQGKKPSPKKAASEKKK